MSKYVEKPSFCFIAPPYAYDLVKEHMTKTHLVLAHVIDKYPEYTELYKRLSDEGHFIIMDNGAFELGESYEASKLEDLAEKVGAHVVVCPDYPFQEADKTIEAAEKFLETFSRENTDFMFVPQSEKGDLDGWIKGYEFASRNDRIGVIGMSILGIPNALPLIDRSFARVVMSQLLLREGKFNHNKHHHYLGLNAGPALEIPSLLRMKVLDTCDSSNPTQYALYGGIYSDQYDSGAVVKSLLPHVQFASNEWLALDEEQRSIKAEEENFELQMKSSLLVENYKFINKLFEKELS